MSVVEAAKDVLVRATIMQNKYLAFFISTLPIALFSLQVTSNQLPDWAGGQYEIVADPFIFHENTLWVADDVIITKPGMGEQTENLTADNNITEELQATTLQQKIYEIHVRT